jgi:hypothetical protein
MLLLLDLAGVSSLEGFVGELPWTTHASRLLDRMGSIYVFPCFFAIVWFQEKAV